MGLRFEKDILDVVHGSNGSVGVSILGETDESEATAAAGIAVLNNDLYSQTGQGVSGREDVGWGGDVQPPQRRRTPRTWCEELAHPCATQGLCMNRQW